MYRNWMKVRAGAKVTDLWFVRQIPWQLLCEGRSNELFQDGIIDQSGANMSDCELKLDELPRFNSKSFPFVCHTIEWKQQHFYTPTRRNWWSAYCITCQLANVLFEIWSINKSPKCHLLWRKGVLKSSIGFPRKNLDDSICHSNVSKSE